MKIKLMIDEEEKTFTAGRPKGRMVRKAIALGGKLDPKRITEDTLDELMDFVVEVYDGQFTRDDVYDGLYSDELLPTVTDTVKAIAEGTAGRLNNSKNG